MNKKPTVSVIIPTYNRAHLIGRAIESVLNQTYQDFELIIVDDASTDNTEYLIKEFQQKDKRISYSKHDRNKGGSAARNTGIKTSKGQYIAFQDSDDEWLPGKLEKQMEILEKASQEVGVIYTAFWRVKGDKKQYIPSEKVLKKEGDIHNELLKGNFITTQSIVVRKDCLEKVGYFDENLPRLQDWELVLRLSEKYIFKFIDEPLLSSYYNDESISADNNALINALEIILTKHHSYFIQHKKILAIHYFKLGINLCINSNFEKGKQYLLKALKYNPIKLRYFIILIVSMFGQNNFRKFVTNYKKVKYNMTIIKNN
jgi:glycosyltransferase involved in cell wall biosynthesis